MAHRTSQTSSLYNTISSSFLHISNPLSLSILHSFRERGNLVYNTYKEIVDFFRMYICTCMCIGTWGRRWWELSAATGDLANSSNPSLFLLFLNRYLWPAQLPSLYINWFCSHISNTYMGKFHQHIYWFWWWAIEQARFL